MIGDKKFAEATAALEKLKAPVGVDSTRLNLLRAAATAGTGDTQGAYRQLLLIASKEPNPLLEEDLMRYGAGLKKSRKDVETDIWQARTEKATVFKDFELVDFADGKKVKLPDYRGRVVFVNFWFPT
jgi:hypothetical protein